MKWSDLPWWLRAIIIIVSVIFIYNALKAIVSYVQSNKKEWYWKWLATQKEIRELLFEKQRILKLLAKAQWYALVTLTTLKIVLLFVFTWFTYWLFTEYKMDQFSAIATAGGTVVTLYSIIAALLNRKIRGLNELLALANEQLEQLFQRKLKAEPVRILHIECKLEALRKEACLLKEKLRS